MKRQKAVVLGSLLLSAASGAGVADELFITVSSPGERATSVPVPSQEGNPFITVSSPLIQGPDFQAAVPEPGVEGTDPASNPVAEAKSVSSLRDQREQEQKLLRDPFWPVGFFPPDWNRPAVVDDARRPDAEETGWSVATAKIRVSGTSQMAGRTAAIVNGELKLPGDRIEVKHEGRIYGWRISSMETDGRIQLRRDGVK